MNAINIYIAIRLKIQNYVKNTKNAFNSVKTENLNLSQSGVT